VLRDAPFRLIGPIQAQVGANVPVRLILQLAAAEPVEAQAIKLLAAQLSSRLSLPVQLSGKVNLEGDRYELAIEKHNLSHGATSQERQALRKLAEIVKSRPDLRLKVTVAAREGNRAAGRPLLLCRQIESTLARNGLQPWQWNIECAPREEATASSSPSPQPTAPVSAGDESAQKARVPALRAESRVLQEF